MTKKIKYLSLIGPDTKTSYGIMSQIYKNCDMEEHQFLVLAYEDCMDRFPKLYEFENLLFIPKNKSRLGKIKFLYDIMKNSEHIIFHSLYFTTYKYNLFFYIFKSFLKKSTWIEWGADLYLWQLENNSLKNRIKNHIAYTIRNSFGSVGFTFPINDEVYLSQFTNRPKFFYTPMPNPIHEATGLMDKIDSLNPEINPQLSDLSEDSDSDSSLFDVLSEDDFRNFWNSFVTQINEYDKKVQSSEISPQESFSAFTDYCRTQLDQRVFALEASPDEHDLSASAQKPIRIQVAHNSFSFNNHVKLLNYLKQFKDENIELVIPLTYGVSGINGSFGGREYINVVSAYAKKIFGNKVTIMTENLPFEEYVKFLWTVDIAIFDFDRPCGLGNIRILLYMGKKIFLPSGNSFYTFLQKQGIKVADTNAIRDLSYEEFIAPPIENDLTWIKSYLNNDDAIAHWIEMFKELDDERS